MFSLLTFLFRIFFNMFTSSKETKPPAIAGLLGAYPERGFILVTHYQRLLNYIEPDQVHVLAGGRIVRSGDKGLALELEARGYAWLEDEVA